MDTYTDTIGYTHDYTAIRHINKICYWNGDNSTPYLVS